MFKKPPSSTKSINTVRSSDVRNLRKDLVSLFSLSPASASLLLPDNLTSQRLTTHLEEPCIIYSSPDGNPLWFRAGKGNDGAMCPTVYSLLLREDLLPVLITAREVEEHLVSGAALFLKGVSRASLEALPDSMLEGNLVAIATVDGIVAMGQLAASKEDLLKESISGGKAVHTLQAKGDHLWKMGNGETTASVATSDPTPPPNETEEVTSKLATTSLSAHSEEVLTPVQVDSILTTSLLLSIRSIPSSAFPMTGSTLYSNYILPNRPANPANAAAVDIKKSSWKKMSGMMKSANKEGWIKAKEVKGEWVVMSVDQKHADVESVRSYKTISQANNQAAKAAAADPSSSASTSSHSSSPHIVVKEYLKPSSSVSQFFEAVEHDRPASDLYPLSSFTPLLKSYLIAHSLIHLREPKYFNLDPLLSSCLLKKGEVLDVMSREDGVKRLKAGCTSWWGLQKANDDEVVKKGSPPVVVVKTKTVGKRMVTLVSGYEPWGLFTAEELAEDLKHRAASSTAVQPISGMSPKTPKYEIMVQGSHESLVMKVLAEKGVPKAYIEVDHSKVKK